MNSSARDLRKKAMDLLDGKYSTPILTLILFLLAMGVFEGLATMICGVSTQVVNGITVTTVNNPGLYSIFNIVSLGISAAIAYAYYYMTIRITTNQEFTVEEVALSGFKNEFWRNVVLYFLYGIFVFLWALLFIIPGIIKAYAYSMGFYLANKESDISGNDAITKSKELMNGHKMDLFILDLSYLGWYILGLFTLGILWLWIIPRHYTARTLFFDEIYGAKIDAEAVASQPLEETYQKQEEGTL